MNIKKLSLEQHVLKRPNVYVGSKDKDLFSTYIYDEINDKIIKKDIVFIPGLYKLFDEIIVNAIDHYVKLKHDFEHNKENIWKTKNIKINICKETGEISVYNDGNGIDVFIHPEYNLYIPELIFGNLLTSSNYDDDENKIIGGQNGLGAKLVNIFSKFFKVETVDSVRKLQFTQEFSKNMSIKNNPIIKKCSKAPYTKITFIPDYDFFDYHMTDDLYSLFLKRSLDVCANTDSDVTVWLNDKKIEKCKTFEKYVNLYIGDQKDHPRVYEKGDRYEIIATFNENMKFEHISFVNSIYTFKGGKHVEYISNQIVQGAIEKINKKKKGIDIKPNLIKNNLLLFVKITVNNPNFDSQTKEYLTTPVSKFGTNVELSDRFIDKLVASELISRSISLFDKNTQQQNKKTDGKKQPRIRNIPKLEDANWAGTNKSKECVLILTEGDSAKAMALEGISSISARDKYGVYPLRGKLMNVKDTLDKKIYDNKEIQDIKKIIGLESGKKYENIDELRYGKIMILTDSDVDGSHIKGLIMNMIHTLWPSLLQNNDFVISMVTPIVKASKGKNELSFYNLNDYKKWTENIGPKYKDWKIKYYKGLGTSKDEEAKQYFEEMHLIHYNYDEKQNVDYIFDLAFNKKRTNERKSWIAAYDQNDTIEIKNKNEIVSYTDFFNKEFKPFSVYDGQRSIPNLIDGLKPSQRKILHGCFKRNLNNEIKVSQLSGYISEHCAYHHGEASLQQTIINMAQKFVGSNNIEFLVPNGTFGTRNLGGKDAAQPRYIYTLLSKLTYKLFPTEDFKELIYLEDDGFPIEPLFYVPILPTVLINGACGIGTGFSTNIPAYNPKSIITVLKHCIANKGNIDYTYEDFLSPWYRGFQGRIEKNDKTYVTYGNYKIINDKTVEINELPIGTWTEDYKIFLDNYIDKNFKILKDFESHSNKKIKFILHFYPGELDKILAVPNKFEQEFHLISRNITTSNMHLFDKNGCIKKFNSVIDIIKEFYITRFEYYIKRKNSHIQYLQNQIIKANAKAKFIYDVTNNSIKLMGEPKEKVVQKLHQLEYPLIEHDEEFSYLLKMPIYTFTKEKYDELINDVEQFKKEYDIYSIKTEENLWYDEIELFEKEYDENYHIYMKQHENENISKTKKIKHKS